MEEETKGDSTLAKIKLARSGTMPNARKATKVVMAEAIGVSSASFSILRSVDTSSRSRIRSLDRVTISAVEYSVITTEWIRYYSVEIF